MTLAQRGGMSRFAWLFLFCGCVGDLVELTPGAPKVDMAQAQPQPDLSGPAAADGPGASSPDLAQPVPPFNPQTQTDIDTLGCSAASCHGGTQVPLLKRMPLPQADITANYEAFKAESMGGESAPVLVRNLAGSGVTHTGGSSFASKND